MRIPYSFLLIVAVSQSLTGAALADCYDRNGGVQRRFVLKGGEAFDTKTGLTWKRCSVGLQWDGQHGCAGAIAYMGLTEAKQVAAKIDGEWRVPSGPELESIIDPSCGRPVVDPTVFPDIRNDDEGAAEYWTTNPVGAAGLFYVFDFMTGGADGHSDGIDRAVRLVKAGSQELPIKAR